MVEHIICVDISTFHFPLQNVLQKIFFMSTTFKFWNFPVVHILEKK